MHLHLVEHNRGIGKGTRSYEVLIGVVLGEVVALIVRVEVAREVLIEVGVGIALIEVVLRETLATGVVLMERAVRRMAMTIEALTVTMICKGCVLVSGGRTRSISESASVVVAAAEPWTMEGPATIVVSLLIATVWGRLVRWPVSCRRVILSKLAVVVGVHTGSSHIVIGVVLEMLELSSGQ
jgi:hypothetical protein